MGFTRSIRKRERDVLKPVEIFGEDYDAQLAEATEKGGGAKFSGKKIAGDLGRVLHARGILKLYSHQAKGLEELKKGKHVVITAPTASGKTEVYLIPVAEAALSAKTSLVVYPTKALSRDQLDRFREFSIMGLRAEVYDGDTPQHARRKIRENPPHVLITNMDMLHYIVMNSRLFEKFLPTLEYVVVDEIHTYSGVMGAHASNILARLKRVLRMRGVKPQFIACSATVGNAKEFAEKLFGEKFAHITAEGAPKPSFKHVMVNPSASYVSASMKIAKTMLARGKKTLVFGDSHNLVERMALMAKETAMPLTVYRAGLSHEHRRKTEAEFRHGKLKALATTSALELGMDIGDVDAIVLAGFPGTVTRVRQRIGRAGRKGQEALAFFVARENPLDQYYFENKREYLHGRAEDCYVNPGNNHVLKLHMLAMMRDFPLSPEEPEATGREGIIEELAEEGLSKKWAGVWIPTKKGVEKLRSFSIRGGAEPIRIYDVGGEFLGTREESLALGELFPGAVYLHGGSKYVSKGLDLEGKKAYVARMMFPNTEYTVPLSEQDARVVEELKARDCLGGRLSYGSVHVHKEVYGYMVKDYMRDMNLGRRMLEDGLVHEYDTFALWLDIPEEIVFGVQNFPDGLHAVEHITISMMPALTGADPKELGGISYPSGRMFVYDGVNGGAGLTEIVYGRFEEAARMAHSRLKKCGCKNGCPKCILDPMCGNANKHLSKESGLKIFEGLLKD